MERWFQNTRGLVIVILAVATGVLLLAIEPGDGFPTGIVAASSGGTSSTTTPSTSLPSSVTTTTVARPTLQEGTADTANTIVVQTKLASLGYTVGTPDGSFAGHRGAGRQVPAGQQDQPGRRREPGHERAGVVRLVEPSTTTTTVLTERAPVIVIGGAGVLAGTPT